MTQAKSRGKLYFIMAGISESGMPFVNQYIKHIANVVDSHYILTTYAPGYTGGVPVDMVNQVKAWEEYGKRKKPLYVIYTDDSEACSIIQERLLGCLEVEAHLGKPNDWIGPLKDRIAEEFMLGGGPFA